MPGGAAQPLERRDEGLNQEGPEEHLPLSPLQHLPAPPQTPPGSSSQAPASCLASASLLWVTLLYSPQSKGQERPSKVSKVRR